MNELNEVTVMEQIHTTCNGCNITLNFPTNPNPDIRKDLARALLAAVEEQAEIDAKK